MKYAKAIEILDLNIKEVGNKMPADTLDALKLGREALRFCKLVERYPHFGDSIPLPSQETNNLHPFDTDLYAGLELGKECPL